MAKHKTRPMFVDEEFWELQKASGKPAPRFTRDLAKVIRETEQELSPLREKEKLWRFKI